MKESVSGDRKKWISENRSFLMIFLVISIISFLFIISYMKFISTIFIVLLTIFSLFYLGKYLIPKFKGIRELPFIKIFIIAASWLILVILIPFIENEHPIKGYSILLISFFVWITGLANLFDIKDLEIDKTKTVPNYFGVNISVGFAIGCILLSSIMVSAIFPNLALGVTVFFVVSIFPILKCRTQRSDFFFSFWIDGLLYLPSILYIASDIIFS